MKAGDEGRKKEKEKEKESKNKKDEGAEDKGKEGDEVSVKE